MGDQLETTFQAYGHMVDLDRLYRAMYAQSRVEDGERVFHGNSADVRAVKRLLGDLFGVPVRDNVHPINDAIRKESETRLAALGWATKDAGRSARYVLHRDLSTNVSAFLLTWNPDRGFEWNDREEIVRETNAGRLVDARWSVGSRTSGMYAGDRVFLIRLGAEPRGVVASGYVEDDQIHDFPHWDGTPGKRAHYAFVSWDRAVDDSEVLPLSELQTHMPTTRWNPQGGGVQLSPDDAGQLEQMWHQPTENRHSDPSDRRQAREAGYLADAEVRAAIEHHAERVAASHYMRLGYRVEFVGTFRSYDLHLTHNTTREVRHVEVKGSTGHAATVELTAGEVAHAADFQPTDLMVVSGIAWNRTATGAVTTGDGVAHLYRDWKPEATALTPVRYRYSVPGGGAEVR